MDPGDRLCPLALLGAGEQVCVAVLARTLDPHLQRLLGVRRQHRFHRLAGFLLASGQLLADLTVGITHIANFELKQIASPQSRVQGHQIQSQVVPVLRL